MSSRLNRRIMNRDLNLLLGDSSDEERQNPMPNSSGKLFDAEAMREIKKTIKGTGPDSEWLRSTTEGSDTESHPSSIYSFGSESSNNSSRRSSGHDEVNPFVAAHVSRSSNSERISGGEYVQEGDNGNVTEVIDVPSEGTQLKRNLRTALQPYLGACGSSIFNNSMGHTLRQLFSTLFNSGPLEQITRGICLIFGILRTIILMDMDLPAVPDNYRPRIERSFLGPFPDEPILHFVDSVITAIRKRLGLNVLIEQGAIDSTDISEIEEDSPSDNGENDSQSHQYETPLAVMEAAFPM